MGAMIIRRSARPRPPTRLAAAAQRRALHRAGADRLRVGILGHLSTARWLVAAGVILIFLGALLFPLVLNLTEESPRSLDAPKESVQPVEIVP